MPNKFGQYILKRPAKAGLFNIYIYGRFYLFTSINIYHDMKINDSPAETPMWFRT